MIQSTNAPVLVLLIRHSPLLSSTSPIDMIQSTTAQYQPTDTTAHVCPSTSPADIVHYCPNTRTIDTIVHYCPSTSSIDTTLYIFAQYQSYLFATTAPERALMIRHSPMLA